MPTISVIVPVYKVEKYIHRCVDSILGQTYADFELILVDDGSPDTCGAICDDYAAKDGRIIVIHQENGGLSAARNAGIDWAFANSDSQWLSFIDSDDWVHPEYLQRLLDAAISNDADLAFCTLTAFTENENGYNEIDFWDKPARCVRDSADILCEAILKRDGRLSGHHVIACNKVYHKELFADIRYPLGQVHEDEAIAHRILGHCNRIAAIDDALYNYRQNPESIMHMHAALYRNLCITLAYGDRILFFDEKKVQHPSYLLSQYWAFLLRYYFHLPKEQKCKKLLQKTKRQMKQVYRCYRKADVHSIKRIFIGVFCCMPRIVSIIYTVLLRLRNV